MKKTILKSVMMVLVALFSLNAKAKYDVEIDGFYYILDSEKKIAEVDGKSDNATTNGNAYWGDVNIPQSIIWDGIEYTVIAINNGAFANCSGVTSVTIPNSVTTIRGGAFSGCSGLTSVNIPNGVTSIDFRAFSGCSSLTSINIPNSVTSIGNGAFSGCSSLASIIIPNSVTSIEESTFYGCKNLTSITIPSTVTSVGPMAFTGTEWLNNQEDGLIYINNVAYVYKGDMPENTDFRIKDGTTSICDNAFYKCRGLLSVTFPNSVTSIGNGAFSGCSSLASIIIPNSVTSIGNNTFSGCSSLTSITIPNSVTSIGDGTFSDCNGLISISIPNSVTSIGGSVFSGCSSLLSVIISENVTSIGYRAFYGCSGLTSMTIPNSVTSIGNSAFQGCSSLTSITIPNSVTSIGEGTFNGCSSLTSITIPNSVTSIGNSAFQGCSSLTSITIPNSITSIGSGAFRNCSSLTSITIPNSITSIPDYTFSGCPFNSVNILMDDLLSWCNSSFASKWSYGGQLNLYLNGEEIKQLVIPNGVTSINSSAFRNCGGLTSVIIPNSVTNIYGSAFENCTGLTSVSIPESITSIGAKAFAGCSNMNDLFCYAQNVPLTGGNAFQDTNVENATLHVPDASMNLYNDTAPWNEFGTIKGLSGDELVVKKCATPTIAYEDGELKFACATEGAEFVSEITDDDIKKHYNSKVKLNSTYNISVYATVAGYENSDAATATLCWIETEPKSEDLPDGVTELKAYPVLIQSKDGVITVQGMANGTKVDVYTINGVEAGNGIATNGTATINTTMSSGEIAIVKIGEKSIKIVVR